MSKISDLAEALHQKTQERKISWELQDKSSIYTIVGKNSIFIRRSDENDDHTYFNVSIFDIDGNKIDEEFFANWNPIFSAMEEMVTKAKRDALRADETLDDILSKVNSL